MAEPLPSNIVIKLGGSLITLTGVERLVRHVLAQRPETSPLLIVGGGAAADVVRDWDRTHSLGESVSHWLALEAMALNESLMQHLLPELRLVRSPAQFRQAAVDRRPALLCASCFVRWGVSHGYPLAETWEVTSDSIAAWTANILEAQELILLKSVPAPLEMTAPTAAAAGLVDPAFPEQSKAIPKVSWVNARSPSTTAQGPFIECWDLHNPQKDGETTD